MPACPWRDQRGIVNSAFVCVSGKKRGVACEHMQVRNGREENSSGCLCLIFPSKWHSLSALTCSGPLFHHYLSLLIRVSVPVTSDYAYPTRLALNLGHFICGGPHNKMSLSAFQFQIFIEKPHWPTSSKHFDAGHTSLGSHKAHFALDCPWERCLPLVPL